MNAAEILVPLGLFFMITVSVALLTRLIATGMLNRTIREALRSDPGSVPRLIDKLEARQPWADSLLGWIFLAFAASLAGLALLEEGGERLALLKAAVIPVVVGVTVLLYVRFAQPRTPAP
jgi:hypothetical protein